MSKFEREEWVPSVVLAPAERYVVEVRYEKAGRYALVNQIQAINHMIGEFEAAVDTLGVVTVAAQAASPDYATQFAVLRKNAEVSRDIEKYRAEFDREPDLKLTLTLAVTALPAHHRAVHERGHGLLRAGGVGGRHA